MNDLTGRLLHGQYRIVRLIGEGAMGQVYLAQARHGLVALKVMRPELARDARFRERFATEARSLETLRHPHIVSACDHFIEDGCCCIVMEYVHGESLAERLYRVKVMTLAEALAIVEPVLDALDYAHTSRFVHRDVKPANILLDRHGKPKLCDFGIAYEIGSRRLTAVGRSVGTPEYMSPEQFKGGDISHTSDVYSTGVVLFEMLTGQLPFDGNPYELAAKHTHEPPPDPASLSRAVTRELGYIILKSLRKAPNRRFQGCADFADKLRSMHAPTEGGFEAPAPSTAAARHQYEIYLHELLKPQALEQGFSWPALVLNLIWMWRHGLSGLAAFWCAAYLALLLWAQASPETAALAKLGALFLLVLPALRGNAWRARRLTRLGYRRTSTVVAATAELALLSVDDRSE